MKMFRNLAGGHCCMGKNQDHVITKDTKLENDFSGLLLLFD